MWMFDALCKLTPADEALAAIFAWQTDTDMKTAALRGKEFDADSVHRISRAINDHLHPGQPLANDDDGHAHIVALTIRRDMEIQRALGRIDSTLAPADMLRIARAIQDHAAPATRLLGAPAPRVKPTAEAARAGELPSEETAAAILAALAGEANGLDHELMGKAPLPPGERPPESDWRT
jgi:hypothetical protein